MPTGRRCGWLQIWRRQLWPSTVSGRSSMRHVQAKTTWFSCWPVAMVAWGLVVVCVKIMAVSAVQRTSCPTSTVSALDAATASCLSPTLYFTPCTVVPRRSCRTWRLAMSASQVYTSRFTGTVADYFFISVSPDCVKIRAVLARCLCRFCSSVQL